MDGRFVIGVDIGGTFTDLLLMDDMGHIQRAKVSSTPSDPSIGVMDGLEKISGYLGMTDDELLASTARLVYGTTIATNALIQRKGSDVALITTKGFKDNLNIRRMWRENTFDLRSLPPVPIVPRDRIYEVTERVNKDGDIIEPLVEADVKLTAQKLKESQIRSVAVTLLFSFLNPAHEQRIKQILLEEMPDINVSLSSEVCPEIREYERCSTTVINAYLATTVGKHFQDTEGKLAEKSLRPGLQVMQSNGGVATTSFIADRPVNIFLSGPAGGVVGSTFLGEKTGRENNNFITVDMGGTSFDICLLNEGQFSLSTTNIMHGWHINVPMIDIHTIGAGGGSLAWLDIAGGLHVGPQSAGAVPGPACYMRGGEDATVTDADLVLGYLSADYFLGGDMKISVEKAEGAIRKIADPLGMSLIEAANGIFRIVNNNMLNGMRVVTVEKGYDPRDYALIVFGGAGAVHLPAFASELGIKHIIIPRDASVFSAMGLIVSDMRHNSVRNLNKSIEEVSLDELKTEYHSLLEDDMALLTSWGANRDDIFFEMLCDLRFPGQYRELTVSIPSVLHSLEEVESSFKDNHERLYGFIEETPPMIVNLRVNAVGKMVQPQLLKAKPGGPRCDGAIKTHRSAFFHEDGTENVTPVYDGQKVCPGNEMEGPAIIELPTTTIVVRPGQSAYIDELCNFNIVC